ncbi:Glutathione transporter 1 [Tolypocladium ophioglossoides CBS 100239]|uniref:Glutathione transporter 1 n=1 Tax=Tolypocladium ophioglossoides (strain CBS 100239) TaxID=1163406 RepID=A0A0L0N042_TOLOC|nr:Glutathione transporter 1 [Tolypocladium ophioglossoides CBS 100239]
MKSSENGSAEEAVKPSDGIPIKEVKSLDSQFDTEVAEIIVDDDVHHDVIDQLKEMYGKHVHDFNFPSDMLKRAADLIANDTDTIDPEQARVLLHELNEQKQLLLNDSPYPEVRAVVEPTDDPTIPVNTFRVWFLGTVFAIIGTGINQFFSLRYPGISIASSVAQHLAYPCGVFMAKVLPEKKIPLGPLAFTLNPGPFNQKEHMAITIMSNVSYGGYNGTADVTYIIQVLKLEMFYGDAKLVDSAGWQILLALSTQLIGYGAAGITRRILVYPAEIIWPKSLAQIALNKALHHDDGSREQSTSWKLTRYRFFIYAFVGMFLYFWLPNYLFVALSTFNWMTWISPDNIKLAIITGSVCGMGINPISTFDWNQATYIFDPIITPFFAACNMFAGMAIAVILVIIPVYWSNALNTAYFPINSNYVFDNTGQQYNISRVLNSDYTLNEEKYKAYSVPYLSAASSVVYATFFGVYLACVVHTTLYNRGEVVRGFSSILNPRKSAYQNEKDIHNRLMRVYKEAPEWWYLALLAVSFVMACCCCALWDTSMPIWGVVLAIVLCFFIQVPVGLILAISNAEVTLNVIAEFIGGYAMSGKPVANMMFKAYGYIACIQSIQFSSDLKLAHYCKISPRLTFAVQVWATIIGAFVSIGVNQWQLVNIKDVCTADQPDKFSCPGTHTFFTASVIWGAIGPQHIFGTGQIYNPLGWGFLAGALLPIPFFFLQKWYPNSWIRYIHVPVILYGPLNLSPYNLSQMWPGFCLSIFFNYYIKTRLLGWWQKYAYVLTSALSTGIGISGIVIFFAVQAIEVDVNWWGNRVPYAGVDGGGSDLPCVLKQVPQGGI